MQVPEFECDSGSVTSRPCLILTLGSRPSFGFSQESITGFDKYLEHPRVAYHIILNITDSQGQMIQPDLDSQRLQIFT